MRSGVGLGIGLVTISGAIWGRTGDGLGTVWDRFGIDLESIWGTV